MTTPAGAPGQQPVDAPRPGEASDPGDAPGPASPPEPVAARPPRLVGVDIARGLAILGMFAAHTLFFEDEVTLDPSTWAGLVQGRSSILFAVLAGVSVALMTGGDTPKGGEELARSRVRITLRAVLLFALGSVLQAFDVVAVILQVYAVLTVATLPFLRWKPGRLFGLAAVVALVAPVVVLLLSGFWFASTPGLVAITLTDTYPALTWSAFVLLGLGVGRLELGWRYAQRQLVGYGLLLALVGYTGGWVTSSVSGILYEGGVASSVADDMWEPVPGDEVDLSGATCWPQGRVDWYCLDDEAAANPLLRFLDDLWLLTGAAPHSGTTWEVVGSSGVALLVLGLCLLAPGWLQRVLRPLAAAGTMALTLYALHVVVLGVLPYAAWDHGDVLFWSLAGGGLLLASLWTWRSGRGPVERLFAALIDRVTGPVPGGTTGTGLERAVELRP